MEANSKEYRLTEAEAKFAQIIWDKEPLTSTELVQHCERILSWKKSTTYTVLKKLCERGIFQNENAVVTSKISKEEFYGRQSRKYIEEVFDGSLPRFLAAFCNGRKLKKKEAEEMKRFIEEYDEG